MEKALIRASRGASETGSLMFASASVEMAIFENQALALERGYVNET